MIKEKVSPAPKTGVEQPKMIMPRRPEETSPYMYSIDENKYFSTTVNPTVILL
jgi:hypothetical protein